jgi:hypothetical protein
VEDDGRGDEIVISKPFLLLIRIIFCNDTLASKRKPFRKRVVRLDDSFADTESLPPIPSKL